MGRRRGGKVFRNQPRTLASYGVGVCKHEIVERFGKTIWRCQQCKAWRTGPGVESPAPAEHKVEGA